MMENAKREIDRTIELIKDEVQKNFTQENYQKIYETATELLNRSTEISYLKGRYGALNLLGNASFNICDYEKAQSYFLESIAVAEEMNDEKNLAFGLNNIGIILFRLKQFDKALEYYNKALVLKLKFGDGAAISTSYNNIGLIYNNLKDYDKALEYFKMSVKIDKEIDNRHALCREYNNIGLVWKYKGDRKRSLRHFEESFDLSRDIGYNKGMASAISNIATHYLETGDYEQSLSKAEEGEKIAISINSNNHLMHFYTIISDSAEKLGDHVKALNYFRKYSVLKDKIHSEESRNKIFEMQIRFDTERKEKESELYRIKNEELSLINATKDKFFRIIHHDLLNPFTAIHSTAGFLDKFYDNIDEAKKRNYVKMILGSSERLLKLMDNLFEWVKTQSGEIDFKPEKIDIGEICGYNIDLLQNNMQSKNISIVKKVPKNCFAKADKNMIDTIIRNLISNAIKFTFDGGSITVSAKTLKDMVRVSVQDTGTGIEKCNISRLFKVAETFTTPGTKEEKGTGLGLILAKEFLDINSGRIFVTSRPGKGSKFTIEIPKYS
jgi:signal transduction histidine kinase